MSRVAVDAAGNVVLGAGRDVHVVSFRGELVGLYRGETDITTPPSISGKGLVVFGDANGVRCLSF